MEAVLITGCSAGGIGSSIALAFHAHPTPIYVFATARTLTKLSHLSSLHHVTCLTLDVTSPDSIEAATAVVKKSGYKLKYLVNNSGVGMVMPLLDTNVEDAKKLYDTNVWGMMRMIQAFKQELIANSGTVVNIGSSAGVLKMPWSAIYGSSKAAQNLLSETLRLELEPLGIRVITVVAGIINSNFFVNIKEEFQLLSDSYYHCLSHVLRLNVSGRDTPGIAMSAERFGKEVVVDVFAGKKGNVYLGSMAWGAKWVPVFPDWVVDWYGRKRGQTNEFRVT